MMYDYNPAILSNAQAYLKVNRSRCEVIAPNVWCNSKVSLAEITGNRACV